MQRLGQCGESVLEHSHLCSSSKGLGTPEIHTDKARRLGVHHGLHQADTARGELLVVGLLPAVGLGVHDVVALVAAGRACSGLVVGRTEIVANLVRDRDHLDNLLHRAAKVHVRADARVQVDLGRR